MDFIEKYKNPIYYFGLFAVTLWPFVNLWSSPTNAQEISYREYIVIFFVVFVLSLMACEAIRWIFKIDPIKIVIFYSFFSISFLYYQDFSSYFFDYPVYQYNIFSFIYLFIASTLLFYFSKSKTFHLSFLVFILVVFLFSFGEFLNLKITTNKPYGHAITPDSVAFEFKTKPNIYFLLFDAYPRHDTLLSERDNSLFLTFFKNKEFIVADKAYSNYSSTWPSVSSTFQMSYLQEGDVVRNDVLSPLKEVFIVLKKNNYDIAVVPSHYSAFNADNVADSVFCDLDIRPSFASSILNYLGKAPKRVLNIVVPFCVRHRYFSMNEIEKVASFDKQKPLFTFIHFVQFHDYVYNSSCEVEGPQATRDIKCNSACLEKFIEKAVDALILKDPNAIIIAQSDHGPWYWFHKQSEDHPNRFDRGYGIFSAFRLPNLDVSEDIKGYLQDTPSPVNNFRIVFALLADKKPELLSYRAFVNEPSNGISSEFVSIEEKIDLDKRLSKLNYLKIYRLLENSDSKADNQLVIRSLLEKNGYKNWNKLNAINQKWLVDEIGIRAAEAALKKSLATHDYPAAYYAKRNSGNEDSDEELIRSLLERKGYKSWHKVRVVTRIWAIVEIVAKARRLDLETFLAKQDYPLIYRLTKDSGNDASDEELVKYILEQNGYKNWSRLRLSDREWAVAKVTAGGKLE